MTANAVLAELEPHIHAMAEKHNSSVAEYREAVYSAVYAHEKKARQAEANNNA